MSNETVNPESVSDDEDEIDALVADAVTEEDSDVDEDELDDDADDDDSDTPEIVEEQPKLDLSTVPDNVKMLVETIIARAQAAYDEYKSNFDIVRAADDVLKTVTEQWTSSTDPEIVEAREKYTALLKDADAIRSAAEVTLKASLESTLDADAVQSAKDKLSDLRKDFNTNVSFADDQFLKPANIHTSIATVLPALPRLVAAKQTSTGQAVKKPRVNAYYRYTDSDEWSPITMKVTVNGEEKEKSSFTALRLWATKQCGRKVTIEDLHGAWYDTAGTTNPEEITGPVEFSMSDKDKRNFMVLITPQPAKK